MGLGTLTRCRSSSDVARLSTSKDTTPMLREQILRVVQEEIDLEDVNEVRNAAVPTE